MRGVLAIAKLTFRSWLRSKSGLFFSLLFPIMLLLIFGLVFGGGNGTTYTLYVQNNDLDKEDQPTEISQTLIKILNSTEVLELKIIPPGIAAREYVLEEAKLFLSNPRLLIIPKGFSEKFINSTAVSQMHVVVKMIEYMLRYLNETIPEETKATMLKGEENIREFIEKAPAQNAVLILMVQHSDSGADVIRGILENVLARFSMHAIGASPVVELKTRYIAEARGLTTVDYYLPGLVAAFIMTNGILGTAPVVSDYRRKGIIKRLAATPLTKLEWILGNILTQSIMGFILTGAMIAVGYVVFNVVAIPSPLGVVLIILGAAAFSGLGMLIAGTLKDVEAVSGLANAIAFPMMFLSGAFWPVEIMPKFMQTIAKYLPLTFLAEGLRADMVLGDPDTTLRSLTLVILVTVVFVLGGVLATKWREE